MQLVIGCLALRAVLF